MSAFDLSRPRHNSIWGLFRMRDVIQMDPDYQREGGIWTLEKRQLLIDTILNGFDVPKIYLHKFDKPQQVNSKTYEYAVIDGKQRLEAIWDFIDGVFPTAESFQYIRDNTVQLSRLSYADIGKAYPDIKTDFDSYPLDIVAMQTDDLELIEELFSRLNEAVPLNAAEKRNAWPGPMPGAVRRLVQSGFFTQKLPFGNRRYRHHDLGAKALLFASRDTVADTKKAYIDAFFRSHEDSTPESVQHLVDKATAVVDAMSAVFVDSDVLLRSVGMVTLYFLLFERAYEKGLLSQISRKSLIDFDELRVRNRKAAEQNLAEADYRLLEFDRYTQSPNDGVALRYRLGVIDQIQFNGAFGFELPEIERS